MTPEEALEHTLREAGALDDGDPWWIGLASMTAMMIRALRETEDPTGYFAVDFYTATSAMHLVAAESTPHAMREVIRWALERLEQMEGDDGQA